MHHQDDFLRLLLRHEAELRAFIGSIVHDPHAREDVFQETASCGASFPATTVASPSALGRAE